MHMGLNVKCLPARLMSSHAAHACANHSPRASAAKIGDPANAAYKDLMLKLTVQGLFTMNDSTVVLRVRQSDVSVAQGIVKVRGRASVCPCMCGCASVCVCVCGCVDVGVFE